jgi:predicted outer membrane protein
VLALLLLVVAGAFGALQPANAAAPPPDLAYLNAAHQYNLTITEAARGATTKGKTACVRQVAAALVRDHDRLSAQEAEVATRLNLKLPSAPSEAQRKQLDALAAKSATAYDASWLALQRQLHQQYLALISGDLPISASPAVESLASGAKPVLEMHQRAVAGTACKPEPAKPPVVPTGEGGQQAAANEARSRAALLLVAVGALLLLVGKSITVRRRLIGIGSLAAGLVMLFGGQPANSGDVPDAGRTAGGREAAVPPVKLKLPGVLEASVQAVGTSDGGELQVPKSKADVGWWAAGAAPGAQGGTVLLAGHVDTTRGRGVFAPLADVPVGTRVGVTSGDGEEHWYRIVARRTYHQQALPADLFHGSAKPRLALVTCTGSYDHKAHRYSENLVLYGVPLD